jgi:citrate synthase
MSTAVQGKGLEGIVAANSGICFIDGEAGVLAYRGIDIHELAVSSTFEETTYLLWNGILPNQFALREFQSQLALARSLDQRIVDMLRTFPATATPWRCCELQSPPSAFTMPTRRTAPTMPTSAKAIT